MKANTNPINPMTWQTFRDTLLAQPDKHLQFEYAEGQFVAPSYHITEIKQAPIVSVDCGGQINSWTEVIVQLWEPPQAEAAGRSMKVTKALSIIAQVEKLLPLSPMATVKIEFGHSRFDTRQLFPARFVAGTDTLTAVLTPDYTQCKAQRRNESGPLVPAGALLTERNPVETMCCVSGTGC